MADSSNPERGESLVVLGPHRIPIKFDMTAIRMFEKATGKGLIQAFGNLATMQFNDFHAAILVGARRADPRSKLTDKKLDRWMDRYPGDVKDALESVGDAVAGAAPKVVEDDEDEDEGDLHLQEAEGKSVPLSTRADSSGGDG